MKGRRKSANSPAVEVLPADRVREALLALHAAAGACEVADWSAAGEIGRINARSLLRRMERSIERNRE